MYTYDDEIDDDTKNTTKSFPKLGKAGRSRKLLTIYKIENRHNDVRVNIQRERESGESRALLATRVATKGLAPCHTASLRVMRAMVT